jgi:hypothetical protein
MSQRVMTNDERAAAVQSFGYTEREARFLCLAALHGGCFLRRQYDTFLGRADGGAAAQLIERALAQGHARAYTFRYKTNIYHLCARPFYEALGQGDNRNRRKRQPLTIKNKLMGFDFVLACPGQHYLATEQEKLAYFDSLGMPRSTLPGKIYRSAANHHETDRYFVEKYPMFLSAADTGGDSPVVSFCFVDEGLSTLSHFETFLAEYRPLFVSLPRFSVIYVAASSVHFKPAQAVFERFLIRGIGEKHSNPLDPDVQRLLDYFAARQLFETRRLDGFDRAKLIQLRKARDEFSGAQYDLLYERWKVAGSAALLENQDSEMKDKTAIVGMFSTHLLEHNYDLFTGVAA